MNKKGFTLAEVLITLGIIGVVSAMVTPMLGSITPNKEKMQVIKAYKTLNDITQEFLHDPSLFFDPEEGLAEMQKPINPKYNTDNTYSGNLKMCRLLAEYMNPVSKNFQPSGSVKAQWITPDFISWKCAFGNSGGYPIAVVTIDLIEDGGKDCPYSSSCTKPDQFKFKIGKFGKIEGVDELTKVYIETKDRLNNKKQDYKEAIENL